MSMPIKHCLLVKCLDSDDAEENRKKMHPIMHKNLKGGHFTVFPCNCDPPCRDVTEEEFYDVLCKFWRTTP